MLRVLILCFLLVGCTIKDDSTKISHAKKQAANFCSCLNSTVRVIQTAEYSWSVYCQDNLKAENVSYGEEFSCQ